MSGLFSTLNATAQALNAQTVAISVTSKNLANMNNTNYAREYVVFGSDGSVATPQGTEELALQAVSVQQDADPLANQQVISEASQVATYSTQQTWYEQAQASLGESISSTSSSSAASVTDTGLAAALNTYQSAVQAYAADPTDDGTREALLEDAGSLTDNFNQISQNLAQVQSSITTGINTDVGTANTLLTNIAQLNAQIASAEQNNPGSAVDFRDSREADLEQLAAILPVTVTEGSNGEDMVTTPDANGNAVALVQNGTVTGALAYNSTTQTVTGGSASATLGMASGSISGAITAATGPVATLQSNLDDLASQLVTSTNAVYNPSDSATGNFFTATGTTAGTISVDPNVTEANLVAGTNGAGDNSIALAMANTASQTFSTANGDTIDGTLTQYLANATSNLGQAVSTASTNLTDQQSIQTLVVNQRSAVSGVNMDEEMSNLVQYQQAYEASSHVFNILDDLLNTVVNQLGNS